MSELCYGCNRLLPPGGDYVGPFCTPCCDHAEASITACCDVPTSELREGGHKTNRDALLDIAGVCREYVGGYDGDVDGLIADILAYVPDECKEKEADTKSAVRDLLLPENHVPLICQKCRKTIGSYDPRLIGTLILVFCKSCFLLREKKDG